MSPRLAVFDPRRRSAGSAVAWTLAILAVSWLATRQRLPGPTPTVWPPVGFAFLWFLSVVTTDSPSPSPAAAWRPRLPPARTVPPSAATGWPALGAAVALAALASLAGQVGAGLVGVDAVMTTLATLAHAWVACVLYRRLRGDDVWSLTRPRDVMVLLVAAAAAGVVGCLLGPVPQALSGSIPWPLVAAAWIRNTLAVYGLGALGLLFLGEPDPDDVPRGGWLLVLAVVGVLVSAMVFLTSQGPLYTFGLVAVPVVFWIASVFNVRQTALFTAAIGLVMVIGTLGGRGPFGAQEPQMRAALVEGLQILLDAVALTLATANLDRRRLLRRLVDQSGHAQGQARLLGTIVEAMPEGILVVDGQGRAELANAAGRELLGDVPDLLTRTGPDGDAPAWVALEEGHVARADIRVRPQRDATERVIDLRAHPLPLGSDHEAVVVARDVTDDRRRTDELRTFARVLSHDLFNPLTASDLWRETLEQELEDERPGLGAEALAELRAANDRMRHVITDLLNYNVARDGRLALSSVDLGALLGEMVDQRLRGITPEQRPTVTVDVQGTVTADPGLMRQLFENLLENAFKYTHPGTPAEVAIHSEAAGPGWVAIHVDDDGIGIPVGQERRIFEEFYRAPHGTVRGSGLGLSICQRVVERHGGRITARRRAEGGSRFTVLLPVRAADSS